MPLMRKDIEVSVPLIASSTVREQSTGTLQTLAAVQFSLLFNTGQGRTELGERERESKTALLRQVHNLRLIITQSLRLETHC